MAESLLKPDSAGNSPGGTTAAENVTGRATPGAGSVNGTPTGSNSAPSAPSRTDPGMTGQTPTGGGKAVPDDDVLQRLDSANSDGGFGDGGGSPLDDGGSGTDIAKDTGLAVTEDDEDRAPATGLPTGGLMPG